MAVFYSVFGLSLACNRRLPRLSTEPASAGEPLHVALGEVPFDLPPAAAPGWALVFESTILGLDSEPSVRIWRQEGGGPYRFLYSDRTEFFVDREGRRLWVRWAPPSSLEDAAGYLLGPILGFVLRLRGVVTLHASSVVVDGFALALAGAAGSGKSTTAAAFAQRGYPILSDDVVALEPAGSEFLVRADCSQLRLWPASSEMLYGSLDALPRLSSTWDKRFLDLEEHGYLAEREPRPLAAVYLLTPEDTESPQPSVRGLAGRRGLMTLVANTYAHLLDRQMQAHEFEILARLQAEIPLLRLRRPTAGIDPLELSDFIVDDFRRLRAQHSASRH